MGDEEDTDVKADVVELKKAKVAVRKEQLRRDAAIAYITDPTCDSLDKLAKHPKFEGRVSRRTLERWCTHDSWVIERQRFLAETFKEMRRRAADTLTQALVADVKMLIDVRAQAYKMLMDPDGVLPRSYEGLMRSFVDMSRRVEEIAREGADRLVPGGMRADDGIDHDALPEGMTADELEAMTRAALAHRRADLEATLAAADEEEDEDVDLADARVAPAPTALPAPAGVTIDVAPSPVPSSAHAAEGEQGN